MFEYSCFLSYRHAEKRVMTTFMQQLVSGLEDYLEMYVELPVFQDRTGLEGGDLFDQKFARALARSVCMIAVYTPTYFDRHKTYCAREYRAMELIEERRFSALQDLEITERGLIIPIILRGKPPRYISDKRNCKYDFSRFSLASRDISRHPEYAQWFDEIGRRVRRLYDAFRASSVTSLVDVAAIPGEEDVMPLLDEIAPFVQPLFPGRLPNQYGAERFDAS